MLATISEQARSGRRPGPRPWPVVRALPRLVLFVALVSMAGVLRVTGFVGLLLSQLIEAAARHVLR